MVNGKRPISYPDVIDLQYPSQNKWPNSDSFCHYFFLSSAKREAVLHSAHSEDTLGAEEKARDVLCAALVLHDRPKSCSYSYCRSKSARGPVRNHNKYITIIKM